MRYFAAIPLALLLTPITYAFEAPHSDSLQAQKEAEMSDTFADFMTGLDVYNGWGETEQNYLEAIIYFERAARGGHKQAQHYLGLMYYKGQGVAKDNIEAYKWFDLAASNGDKVGMVLKVTLKDILTNQELSEAESRKKKWLDQGAED